MKRKPELVRKRIKITHREPETVTEIIAKLTIKCCKCGKRVKNKFYQRKGKPICTPCHKKFPLEPKFVKVKKKRGKRKKLHMQAHTAFKWIKNRKFTFNDFDKVTQKALRHKYPMFFE